LLPDSRIQLSVNRKTLPEKDVFWGTGNKLKPAFVFDTGESVLTWEQPQKVINISKRNTPDKDEYR
jgi:hypothetical protein